MLRTKVNITEATTTDFSANAVLVADAEILNKVSRVLRCIYVWIRNAS